MRCISSEYYELLGWHTLVSGSPKLTKFMTVFLRLSRASLRSWGFASSGWRQSHQQRSFLPYGLSHFCAEKNLGVLCCCYNAGSVPLIARSPQPIQRARGAAPVCGAPSTETLLKLFLQFVRMRPSQWSCVIVDRLFIQFFLFEIFTFVRFFIAYILSSHLLAIFRSALLSQDAQKLTACDSQMEHCQAFMEGVSRKGMTINNQQLKEIKYSVPLSRDVFSYVLLINYELYLQYYQKYGLC